MTRDLNHGSMDRYYELDRLELVRALEEHGHGSFLRGWRTELDPEGTLEVDLPTFSKAAARLHYVGDSHLLFSRDGDLRTMSLEEVSPRRGGFIARFKQWVDQAFSSGSSEDPGSAVVPVHARFFEACKAQGGDGHVNFAAFAAACRHQGFEDEGRELEDLWECCDFTASGSIVREDLISFTLDTKVRDMEIFKAKISRVWEWKQAMGKEYIDGVKANEASRTETEKTSMPPTHRLAPRAWQASTFEALPSVMSQMRDERNRESARRCTLARRAFLEHAKTAYGNEARLMRHPDGLDPDGDFQFSVLALRRYLKTHPTLCIDVHYLWKALDTDEDGVCGLEDLSVPRARVLSTFLKWARERFGSCAAIWESPEAVRLRKKASASRWVSGKKKQKHIFVELLKLLGWPGVRASENRMTLCSALDFYDCGLVMQSDLAWLDRWRPAEWLAATPDCEAWEQLKALLLLAYGHPLRAWRFAMDTDDSDAVSRKEFVTGCNRVGFTGSVAGAWCHLDQDDSRMIGMREFDTAGYELLSSFKGWGHMFFGSAKMCFDALDEDRSGTVTLREMKRACKGLKWCGDVEVLFDCLDVDGRQNARDADDVGNACIELKEIMFLDAWTADAEIDDVETPEVLPAHSAPARIPGEDTTCAGASCGATRGSIKSRAAEPPLEISSASAVSSAMPSTALQGSRSCACVCGLSSGCSPLRQGHQHSLVNKPSELQHPLQPVSCGDRPANQGSARLGGGRPAFQGSARPGRDRPASQGSARRCGEGGLRLGGGHPASRGACGLSATAQPRKVVCGMGARRVLL